MSIAGGARIRVLIVDDVPEARDNVQKLLQFANEVQVVGQGGTGREAIDLARKLHPDIILMDVSMPEMDGIAATQIITGQFPDIAVIMSSVQSDTETLRRSLQAGARDYLFKPYGLEELTTAIRGAFQSVQTSRAQISAATAVLTGTGNLGSGELAARAKVVTLFSPKGGVGRTTLTANLAVATRLATDKRVLLIDGNLPFGDAGVALNLTSAKTICDLASNVSHLDVDFVSEVLATHSSGVKVLLAPPSAQDAETVTPDQLRTIVSQISAMFDFIFIDTRPSFDETQLVLLDLADQVLVVLTTEMTAIKAGKQYLEVAELLGYPSEKTSLVLNRYDAVSQITAEDIEANLKGRIKGRIPDEAALVLRSINEGVPIALSDPESKYGRAITSLASFVTDGLVPAEEEPERRRGMGLFRRNRGAAPAKPAIAGAEG
ncbi:MAG: response regulator [Thermomicrobiales bacterium]